MLSRLNCVLLILFSVSVYRSAGTNGENKRTSEAGVTRGAMTPEASSDAAFSELPLAAASATANEDERPQHAEAEADQDGSLVSSPLRCVQRTNAASADRYERASRADASRRASRAFVPPPTPRSINSHNSRANRETKAAKTVAIICGEFASLFFPAINRFLNEFAANFKTQTASSVIFEWPSLMNNSSAFSLLLHGSFTTPYRHFRLAQLSPRLLCF